MDGREVYRPGICNIGPREQAVRRATGWAAVAITTAGWILFISFGTPPPWRLVLFVPAATAAVALLEGYSRFCVVYGALGVFNVGMGLRQRERIHASEARRKDRLRAVQMLALGLAIGSAVAAAAYFTASL